MKKMYFSAAVSVLLSIFLFSGCSGNHMMKSQIASDHDNIHNHIPKQQQAGIRSSTSGVANTKFSDVSSEQWYADHVQWGSNLGLIDGYPDGTFQPNKPLTRAEVVKIIRSLADKGYLPIPAGGTPAAPENAAPGNTPDYTPPENTAPGTTPGNTVPGNTSPDYTAPDYTAPGNTPTPGSSNVASCENPTIKGNINSKKEKIYHVPGGQFYDRTIAEEMFCTPQEAEAAGYRASLK